MDSQINAAALALAGGDPLAALKRVALREDPSALALRGIAMAQLGELARARELLRKAGRGFSAREPRARARCLLAEAEVALAARDFGGSSLERSLARARETLAAHGDAHNAIQARLIEVRHWLLLGRIARAEAALSALDLSGAPPRLSATGELLRADVALRSLRSSTARAALERARAAARSAGIPALLAEVAAAEHALSQPAARRLSAQGVEPLLLEQVEALLASPALIVDACRRVVRGAGALVSLRRRPVLFALARALAEAWPADVARQELMARAFEIQRANDSHRARLRVEIGRLRRALRPLAALQATPAGFQLQPRAAASVCVLAPPFDHQHASVLALLSDGEAWSSSALALALGASQRTVQRALLELESHGTARSLGRGRAQRWLAPPIAGFTTSLLLPAALPLD
ncbi:MAG TPA: helix-turn-helix domain-containing protein [Polyangiaceae bacterium]|nr:helix-turn-helix domain-containing protein [Polyangiaceae bacterium]